jgi:hypothetical protein
LLPTPHAGNCCTQSWLVLVLVLVLVLGLG